MALRTSPTSKRDKERLRLLKLREEEQDRIIRQTHVTKHLPPWAKKKTLDLIRYPL